MSSYFHQNESIYSKFRNHVEPIVETITCRYIGSNPPHPFTFRAFCKKGFLRCSDYRYYFDLADRFPKARNGQFVYTWAKLWSDKQKEVTLNVTCFGPVRIYVNSELTFKSSIVEELDSKRKTNINVMLQEGWNHVILQFIKTPSGFGGIFGTGRFKRFPFHFLSPSEERQGQEGWIYTEPLEIELETLPSEDSCESSFDVKWYPYLDHIETSKSSQLTSLFGEQRDRVAIAWTKISSQNPGTQSYTLHGENNGEIEIFLNKACVYQSKKSDSFQVEVELPYGEHDFVVKSVCHDNLWGFQFQDKKDDGIHFSLPVPVEGARDNWLYAGSFPKDKSIDLSDLLRVDTLFKQENGETYWRLDMPDSWVRPYLENPLFGKWDYPLGVTLYGLLQTGEELNRKDIVDYALKHIETCTSFYKYSLWDREQYGAASVNTQLSAIDSLDDCGSFGATMLVAQTMGELRDTNVISNDIANYITQIQDRLPDQTLYRKFGSVQLMMDTIWCDDLYMSTPFLCRYYEKTGELKYLDDAVNQFLLYKEYLYIPEKKIMSHVYDFKFNTATQVPWGRGNGWVIFSLSELLAILPVNHEKREELLTFFCELAEGYLALQGVNGLWHQVLTDPESYEESSCTSMFIYAFSRGIRYGWLKEQETYIKAVFRGWEGLSKKAIDQNGNVYGVCQGSGYSFTADYYKHDLTWILNDTHGIGIVLLSGIETIKLQKWLSQTNKNQATVKR
ncbi:glycoside hydrolase family 88/105 protein [Metabacillus bambusae]|uniref:Glycoside hydrolase family 88 protein n=1 Tax=Metabacillus bambusae TaxID=2795218 RepID=A0ABS3N9A4_9BACI|nr:glycoside hydrolase family 88 protein [Metabacillus bambusae]MBO1514875.1 glycoside hydrolase family 88 protein [Metabacillus bambusae]